MPWTPRVYSTLAALSGLVGVAAGAFAAHGLAGADPRELMRTGSTYQMAHALATLACAVPGAQGRPSAGLGAALFLVGTVLFSGSLYALAMGAPRAVGIATPFGGLSFMAGWAALAWSWAGGTRAGA
jgi:uncharacterized membrane protein YgdD (TMEM256/DUF423 family)